MNTMSQPNTDSGLTLIRGPLRLSLKHRLVLAVPTHCAGPLILRSENFGEPLLVTKCSLFICAPAASMAGDKRNWSLQSISLSRLIEILVIVDTARGKSSFGRLDRSTVSDVAIPCCILLPTELTSRVSVDNVVIDLILRDQSEFKIWCEFLRKFEAYGMMSFLLSATEFHENSNINQICLLYGVSAPHFRKLCRERFKITPKKKIMNIRMADAILRLIESEFSILEVGLDAGYCSASHFTNDIKKELGFTPSEIRRLGDALYEV